MTNATTGRPASARRFTPLLWCVGALLLSFNFALNLQRDGKAYLHAEAYIHHHEKRPYQYRVLMAPVLGGLIAVLSTPPLAGALTRFPVYVSTPEAGAYVLINGIGLALSCLLMVAIARRALGPRAVPRVLAIYLVLVYCFFVLNPNVPFILPYDIPSLVLTQACVLAILQRRWLSLYVLFALATLNRETCLLVVLFLALRLVDAPDRRRTAGHVVALVALWLAIKTGLWISFSQLPTDEGSRLGYNLRTLLKPWWWPALLPLLAAVAVTAGSLRQVRLHREWAWTGCIGFVLISIVGQILETRAYADLTTFFALAIAFGLAARDEALAA